MKIASQTKENFIAAGFSQSGVARSLGMKTCTFSQVLNGTYPCLDGYKAQKAINFLREKELLVLVDDGDASGCATVADAGSEAITTC